MQMARDCRAAQRCIVRLACFAFLASVISGCAYSSNVRQVATLESAAENPRVLLMPPDIRYYLITAGGLPEPHAEWTLAARDNFSIAVGNHARQHGTELKIMDDTDLTPTEVRYIKLHEAVGYTALMNHFGSLKLPTKNGEFDWSLGPGVAEIGDEQDADYGLFVFYRDEQASGGRIVVSVLAAAMGSAMSVGREYGFASLVDLQSGDIVWFNVVRAGGGELRTPEGAAAAVRQLFADLPAGRPEAAR